MLRKTYNLFYLTGKRLFYIITMYKHDEANAYRSNHGNWNDEREVSSIQSRV